MLRLSLLMLKIAALLTASNATELNWTDLNWTDQFSCIARCEWGNNKVHVATSKLTELNAMINAHRATQLDSTVTTCDVRSQFQICKNPQRPVKLCLHVTDSIHIGQYDSTEQLSVQFSSVQFSRVICEETLILLYNRMHQRVYKFLDNQHLDVHGVPK